MLTFSAPGFMRRTSRRLARRTQVATRRAVVAVGKEIAAEIQDVIVRLTRTGKGTARLVMHRSAPRPGDPKPVYRIRIRRAVPLNRLGTAKREFRPYKRGSKLGTLTVRQLDGTVTTFEGARREGKGRGVRYVLPKTARYRERTAGGLRVRVDSTPAIQALKRGIAKRLKAEVRRRYRRT